MHHAALRARTRRPCWSSAAQERQKGAHVGEKEQELEACTVWALLSAQFAFFLKDVSSVCMSGSPLSKYKGNKMVHSTLCIAQYDVHSTMCTVRCLQYDVHSMMFTVRYSQYDVHSTMFTVRCSQYDVHSTMFTVRCAQYDVQSTMFTVRCSQYDVHSTMFTVRCSQ